MSTPSEKIDLLRAKLGALRSNLRSRFGQGDVGDLQPAPTVPLAGQNLRIVSSAGGKVVLPREGDATECQALGFAGPHGQNPTPIRSLVSSLFSKPTLSESELEAVRLVERQRARAELAQAEAEKKRQVEAEEKARLEKPAVL